MYLDLLLYAFPMFCCEAMRDFSVVVFCKVRSCVLTRKIQLFTNSWILKMFVFNSQCEYNIIDTLIYIGDFVLSTLKINSIV